MTGAADIPSAALERGTVLVALHDELLSGASVSVLRAVPMLEARGWRFAFWVPSPGSASDWLRARGARVSGAPRPIASGLRGLREPPGVVRRLAATPGYLRSFRRFVREVAPTLVHANSVFSFAEALSARRMGLPTLLHVHDMAPASRKAAQARAICRRMDLTIAVSRACAASYATADWSPPVVYEAAPVPTEPASIRQEPDPFVIGTVGVISRRKGSDLFVAAAEQLAGRGLEFRMVGALSDPLDRRWGEQVLARARRAGVHHLERADVEAELRGWDAFALPSRRDPCPIAMLEAMALGLPVIGARRDGLAEQITSESGLLVEPESPEALGLAMQRVQEMPATDRAALGAQARRRVSTEFTLERQSDGIQDAYERTLENAAQRSGRLRP